MKQFQKTENEPRITRMTRIKEKTSVKSVSSVVKFLFRVQIRCLLDEPQELKSVFAAIIKKTRQSGESLY